MQPLQPPSINSVRSSPRMGLLTLKSVLADLSSEGSFPHNSGPKSRSECLPYVTELYLGVEKSDCLKLYLELCSLYFFSIETKTKEKTEK